jgi:hypothetical protein
MEAGVPILGRRDRVLLGAVLGALFAVPSSAAAAPTKDECIAANESAQDLRPAGKLREARQKLAVCLATSCPVVLREDCALRASEVDAAMPSVVFEAKDAAGNDMSAVTVAIDGEAVAEKLDGRPMALDPGEHRLAFRAASGATAEKIFVVREGEKNRRERIVLAETPEATSTHPSRGANEPRLGGESQRTISFVLGGAGVLGLVVGSVFGLVAEGTWNGAQQNCTEKTPSSCDVQPVRDQAAVATVGFVAGGAFLAGAAALYFTAPKVSSVSLTPTVGASAFGFSAKGVW